MLLYKSFVLLLTLFLVFWIDGANFFFFFFSGEALLFLPLVFLGGWLLQHQSGIRGENEACGIHHRVVSKVLKYANRLPSSLHFPLVSMIILRYAQGSLAVFSGRHREKSFTSDRSFEIRAQKEW